MATEKLQLDQAAELNIEARRGDSINTTITVYYADGTPINFTAYANAKLQVKNNSDDTTSILELTKTSGQIILGASGDINLIVDGDTMNIDDGTYIYDLEVYTDANDRKTVLAGSFIVNNDITR